MRSRLRQVYQLRLSVSLIIFYITKLRYTSLRYVTDLRNRVTKPTLEFIVHRLSVMATYRLRL